MPEQKIKAIFGVEPLRENEYPSVFLVGSDGVTEIMSREENLGEYGIRWFDVFEGRRLVASMNARFVAEVHYQ